MTPHTDFDADAIRGRLAQTCRQSPMSLIRGPDSDPRLIYIRQDLSAWGDESPARHLMDLTDEELSWARSGVERSDADGGALLEEARHWRHIHGFSAWLEGGAHPLDLMGNRATGYRRASAVPELTHQRVTVGGQPAVVTQERHAMLASSPALAAAAAEDPTRAMRAWRSELDLCWREAEFGEAIFFCQDALPAIPPRTPMMARKRRDGSWIFEHPMEPSWLCMMEGAGHRAIREEFPHNGRDPVAIGQEAGADDGDDQGWLE